jgi:RNA-directed DNA polymerase
MKRQGNCVVHIVARQNLQSAFWSASKGRRASRDVVAFGAVLEANLRRMADQIVDGTFPVGRFRSFEIRDPKPRRIFAPAFPERVFHHAIVAVCGERMDRYLIDQTYACRLGRGTHAAIEEAQAYARRWPVCLQLDVRHYFDDVDHARLLAHLQRLFKDRDLLAWFERIIASYEVEPGRGLPIGALTSQHFANLYLGAFDHFAKDQLGCRGYVRYMDDMLLFAPDRTAAKEWWRRAQAWLTAELALVCKPPLVREVTQGIDFLGVRIHPSYRTLSGSRRRRWAVAMRRLCRSLANGRIDQASFARRAASMAAHADVALSRPWRRAVLATLATAGQLVE